MITLTVMRPTLKKPNSNEEYLNNIKVQTATVTRETVRENS